VIILVIVLVLFGGSKLPQLARNLGQAQKEFKSGLDEGTKSKAEKKEEEPEDSV
jgi:sec-independent protein translocase protein TatA